MKFGKKILRIILLSISGIWLAFAFYYPQDNIPDTLKLMLFGLLWISFWIWCIYKDNKDYNLTKKLTSYLTTCIGLLLVGLAVILNLYQEDRANYSTILKGYWENTGFNISKFTIDFKENGSYKMTHGSILGDKFFYGTYIIEDSIITIDKSKIEYIIESDKLIIREEINIARQVNFIQVDKNGKEILNALRFRVIVDNRNNVVK